MKMVSFVERGTVQVYNLKLLMFKRALIVQTRMFKTTLAMKMVRLVDRETRATANKSSIGGRQTGEIQSSQLVQKQWIKSLGSQNKNKII